MISSPEKTKTNKVLPGALASSFGALGLLISLLLLIFLWSGIFRVQQFSSELSTTGSEALKQARERLLESEQRVQRIRDACEALQQLLQERVQEQLGLDEETRQKLSEIVMQVQRSEEELRGRLDQAEALLLLSQDLLRKLQLQLAPGRLQRVVELLDELEALTEEAQRRLDQLSAIVTQSRSSLEAFRDQQIAAAEARLDQLAERIDESLLQLSDAATRSADFVEQLSSEIRALHRQLRRISTLLGLLLSAFLFWNGVAQLCLCRSGIRMIRGQKS